MMSQKYSFHLAKKAYYYAPSNRIKDDMRKEINSQISKLVMHQFASEVIEYVYSQTEQEKLRREMVLSFYGQYFLLIKDALDASEKCQMSLKQFLEKKPQLKQ